MLAAFVTMGFAQQALPIAPDGHLFGNVNPVDRSDWFGSHDFAAYFGQTAANDAYYLTIPADAISAGSVLEKVYFLHLYTTSGQIVLTNTDYTIKLYRGYSIDTTGQFRQLVLGDLIFAQPYSAPQESGEVTVNFTTPYTVVAGESLVLGIEMDGKSAVGLGAANQEQADMCWAHFAAAGDGIRRFNFGDESSEEEEYEPMPYLLAVYYNDGREYVHKSDLYTTQYDPQDEATYPSQISILRIDEYSTTLDFYGGAFNAGLDTAIGMFKRQIYMTCPTAQEPYWIIDDTLVFDEEGVVFIDTVLSGYGWHFGPWNIVSLDGEDPDLIQWSELQELGFEFPLEMCLSIEYVPVAGYVSEDPNTDNDTYCITITDEPEVGISENTNTLSIQPNPASTQITIDNAAGAQVTIYNISGQQVMSIEAASANETINVSNLSEGLYVVRVVNGTEVATSKVSIVR